MTRAARRLPSPPPAPVLTPSTWLHADAGQRSNQEDAALALSTATTTVLVVADGMGGHAAGEIASREAVREVERCYRAGARAADLTDTLDAAHAAVVRAAHDWPERAGMGACAVALAHDSGSGRATVAWVGDCRCWRLRDGHLDLLTEDHGPTAQEIARAIAGVRTRVVEDGMGSEADADVVAAAATRRLRSTVYRALGAGGDHRVDSRTVGVRAGDAYLLCSDGLEDLAPAIIAAVLGDQASADPARDLVTATLALGDPHQDNVAVAVVRFGPP